MNSEDIYNILRNDAPTNQVCFLGVFARDTIPLAAINYPCCMVLNTDPISSPGSHWVAIFKDESNYGYYFDSYGKPPSHDEFIQCLGFCSDWTYNTIQLQNWLSTTCGQYCIYFITKHAKGYSSRRIIDSLDQKDLETNDAFVNSWVTETYGGYNPPVTDYPFLTKQLSTRVNWNGFI